MKSAYPPRLQPLYLRDLVDQVREIAVSSIERTARPLLPSLIGPLGRAIATRACALVLLVAPVVTMAVGTQAPAVAPPPPVAVAVGSMLPDAVLAGLNGPHRKISSYRGRPLIINVWASWCGPCRAEAASLERLAWSSVGSKYDVIGISTDDDRNEALRWLKHSNATLSHYIDSPPWKLEKMLGASSIPVTVLVDANGRVVARFRGAREWDTAESIRLIEQSYSGTGVGRSTPAR